MSKLLAILSVLSALLIMLALSFGITYGYMYVLCWSFGTTFSLKMVVGVYIVVCTWVGIFTSFSHK